jgi:SAM-dependent methyltransferase
MAVAVSVLEILRCPVCAGTLADDGASLTCQKCGRVYAVEDGIPRMLDDALPGIREKRLEIDGWVEKARNEAWYEPDDEVDAALPYVVRDLGWTDSVWHANEFSFTVLLDRYVEPGMRILELGAAKCWGAQHLIPLGCEYVGTDILTDAKIGLGRGAFYEERVGPFARVQADGEHLPFADESFDLTYCAATLHHALDLDRMVKEMARVTRPGGVVAGLNEGTRALGASADAPGQEEEKALGINEHVHTAWAYAWAFLRAGLRVRRIEHSAGSRGRAGRSPLGRVPKIGTTIATLLDYGTPIGKSEPYSGISIYARKPG